MPDGVRPARGGTGVPAYIADAVGVPVTLVGVGPGREQIVRMPAADDIPGLPAAGRVSVA